MEEHDEHEDHFEGQVIDEELDPEREARRRIALGQIRQYPDAALRMEARPVAEFDDELLSLVERMKLLMVDANGIGLAATQVGVLRRVFVFQRDEDEVAAVVNPEIVERSEESDVADDNPVWEKFARAMVPMMMPTAQAMAEILNVCSTRRTISTVC